jgi:hypothetical protein
MVDGFDIDSLMGPLEAALLLRAAMHVLTGMNRRLFVQVLNLVK